MKARDIFGLIVRAIGLVAFLDAIWNLVFGVFIAFGALANDPQAKSAGSYFAFGMPALVVGILLMLLGRQIVRICYPDNKDDSDA